MPRFAAHGFDYPCFDVLPKVPLVLIEEVDIVYRVVFNTLIGLSLHVRFEEVPCSEVHVFT